VILNDNTIRTWSGSNAPAPVKTFTVVTAPTLNPGGRVYVFPTNVVVDCDTFAAVIHYTTNGAEPTENDPVISAGSALRIDRNTVLKVKAWKTGWTPSQSISAVYTVLSTFPPVIFVDEDNPNLAAALDAVTLVRGPFHILSDVNFSSDHHTRVIFYTTGLGGEQSELDLITVQLASIPLTVENVGTVAGVQGLNASFVVVRLPDGLPPGDLPLVLTVRGTPSANSPAIAIAP
jgi:hypothetical protein